MGSVSRYAELQTLKHALQYYIKRPGASERDIIKETHLLERITDRIDILKDMYRIK